MTNSFNSNQNFNELIFENKNKSYGAYALRKEQSDTVAKSMFITLTAVGVLVFGAYMLNQKSMEAKVLVPKIDSLISVIVNITPPPIDLPKDPTPPQPHKSAYSDNMNIHVVDNPIVDPIKANVLLVLNKDGDPKGKLDSAEHVDVLPIHVDPPPVDPGIIHSVVSEMPELKNLYQFIADNLKYPQVAVDAGVVGTVYLSFVVEKDGSIGDVKVLRGIGAGCEEEAMRVVKLMPKWKPGRNNGDLVRVQFNLPIRFKLK